MHRRAGFTLVEMITVIVLLGVVAGVLAPFIKASVDAYADTRDRSHLLDKVRVSLERLSRELRQAAVPTISVGGTLQFMTTTAGGAYVSVNTTKPRIDNAHCSHSERFVPNQSISALCVLYPGDLSAFTANALVIGSDVVPVDSVSPQVSGSPDEYDGALWKVNLSSAQTFSSASASAMSIFSLADYKHRISLSGTDLQWERGIATPSGGFTDSGLLLTGVTSFNTAFDTGSGVVSIDITVSEAGESISISEDVYVRN